MESVRNQSYTNWHHYIIDDGSQDATPALIDRLQGEPRIHAYRFDSNQGVNRARNFLLERILERNEAGFVVILDDDDELEKDALNRFASAIRERPDHEWFIANCHYRSGKPLTRIREKNRPLCFVRDHKLGRQIDGDIAHVFSTEIVGRARFTDAFANAEEWWFFADLAKRSPMHVLDFHAKTQEYLADGLSRSKPNRGRRDEIFELKLARFEPFLNRARRATLEARLGRHLFARGQRRAGGRQLVRAFRRWPFEYRIYTYLAEMVMRSLADGLRRP